LQTAVAAAIAYGIPDDTTKTEVERVFYKCREMLW
jgi:hypothetical protein